MKTFKEFIQVNEKMSMTKSEMQRLAKDIAKHSEEDDDIEEVVAMSLEDVPGAENATDKEISKLADMVRSYMK